MPELPDIAVYIEALEERILGRRLEQVRLGTPFLLRTADPPLSDAGGGRVEEIRRIGKRIAIGLDKGGLDKRLWLVLHLMIAGRLHWKRGQPAVLNKRVLAAFDFPPDCLTLTEAGTQRRASLHLVLEDEGLRALDPGGADPLTCSLEEFERRLRLENHTLKRALTDPHLFSGIGNAYSDEILHRAQLSPVLLTSKLIAGQVERLAKATRFVLLQWIERLRSERKGGFPEGITAFRPEMAVHGKYGEACPVCRERIARIRYAANETNYCPKCQTGGKLLADRALSRLLKADWPRTPLDLEKRLRPVPGKTG